MKNIIKHIKDNDLIPVIVAHYGNHYYLKYVINIAAKNNFVFLLGDESNVSAVDNKKSFHLSMSEYNSTALDFKSYFKNYSNYNDYYAWFISARVFMANQFLKKYDLPYCFFIDSDNFILLNVSEYPFDRTKSFYTLLSDFDNPYRMAAQIGNAFMTQECMDEFEKLCYEIYNDVNNGFSLIKPKIDYHNNGNNPGGICEMTLFYLLSKRIPFINIFEIKDNKIFDHHPGTAEYLNDRYYFKMQSNKQSHNQMKEMIIKNNGIYILDKYNNEIKLNNIHFNDWLKKLIPSYYEQIIKILN